MSLSPPACGDAARCAPTSAPPLDPHIVDALLCHDPARAALFLAAMRPAARDAQAQAHAAICGVDVARIRTDWDVLIARCPRPPLTRPPRGDADSAPYDPEILALMQSAEAQQLIAALAPEQRARQAAAQAHWLASFGYPVTPADILAMWATHDPRPQSSKEYQPC